MASESFYEAFKVHRFGNSEHYHFVVNPRWVFDLSRSFYQCNSRTKIRYIMRRNKYKNQYKWD